MILGQSIPQIWRQQQHLITNTRQEALGHAEIVLSIRTDGTFYATATAHSSSGRAAREAGPVGL